MATDPTEGKAKAAARPQDLPAFEVNGAAAGFDEVLRFLKAGDKLGFLDEWIDHKLAVAGARAHGIAASDAELQRAADDFREERGLWQAVRTFEWLRDRGLSEDDFERVIEERVLVARLRDEAVSPPRKMDAYFVESRGRFDAAELSHLATETEGKARELLAQLREEGGDFAELARRYSIDPLTSGAGGYVGVVRRGDMNPALEAPVFGGLGIGEVAGPIRTDQGFHLVRIHALRKASLEDDRTIAAVRDAMFQEWLAGERRRAKLRRLL